MEANGSIINCPVCNEQIRSGCQQCPNCKTATSLMTVCPNPNCHAQIKADWKVCPYCQAELSGCLTPPIVEGKQSVRSKSAAEKIFDSDGSGGMSDEHVSFDFELPICAGDFLGDRNRYRIIELLGKGGFGTVYKVEDTIVNEQRALKVVISKTGHIEQIIHEFKLCEHIRDTTYIVRTYDPRVWEYKELSVVLLPMELADGGTLRGWLKNNPDTATRRPQVIEYFRQACLGVNEIHNAGIFHLDIKPENILLFKNNITGAITAKIADFGIGRYGNNQFARNPQRLLREGIGTCDYMSPEQFMAARQKDIDQTSDIYSLGIVLFEILDGDRPFEGTKTEISQKHLNMVPPRLKGDIEPIWQIIRRCMSKDPHERYQKIGLLLSDIESVVDGRPLYLDLNCRECGHKNESGEHPKCDECGKGLGDLLRRCPSCGRELRKDVVICSVDDTNLKKHYLLKDREERIFAIKDEDPAETIVLLETVIREGADDFRQEALKLLKDLRSQYEKIQPWWQKAEKVLLSEGPAEAMNAWREVLKIFPRHRVALREKQRLQGIIDEVASKRRHASESMDAAEFDAAEQLLVSCSKLVPVDEKIREKIRECHSRAQLYIGFINKAQSAVDGGKLIEAQQLILKAFEQAANSEEAKKQKNVIEGFIQRAKSLFDTAQQQLSAADFTGVEETLFCIKRIQTDNKQVLGFEKSFKQIQDSYNKCIKLAEDHLNEQQLDDAKKTIGQAIEKCSNSKQAKELLDKINEAMALKLSSQIKEKMDAAEFDEAERLLSEAKKLFSKLPQLTSIYDTLESTKNKYQTHLNSARQLRMCLMLTKALNAAKSALERCPHSQQALDLISKIENAMKIRSRLKKLIIVAIKWIFIFSPALIGFSISLGYGAVLGTASCVICMAAAFVNLVRQTRFYILIHQYGFVKDKNKLLILMAGVLMVISGALFAVHLPNIAITLPAVVFAGAFFKPLKDAAKFLLKNIAKILYLIFVTVPDKIMTGLFWFLKRIFTCLAAPFVITARFIHRTYAKTISATKSIQTFVRKTLSRLFIKTPKAIAIALFTATGKGRYLKIKLLVILTGLFLLAVVYVSNKSVHQVSGDKVLYNDKSVDKSFSRHTEVENPVIDKSATEETVAESKINDVLTKKFPTDSRISEQSSVNKNFTALVKQANDSYDNGQLRTAIGLYRDALKVTDDEDVRQKITDIEKKLNDYKDYMDKGYKASLDPASRKLAFEMYQKAKQIWNSQQVNRTIDSLLEKVKSEIDSNLDQAEELILEGNQDTASVNANSALQLAEQVELKDSINRANSILKQINETVNPGNLVWHKITTEKVSCINDVGDKRDINIRYYYNSEGMKFVYIEPKVTSDKQQQSSFYIGADEVTSVQYRTVMAYATKWFNGDKLPAAGLSWNDAIEFCSKLSKKDGLQYNLPTVRQWEYACTAGLNTKYDCGNTITTDYANFSLADGDSVVPKPVGSYPANILGIYDMHGNVSEWCRDKDGDLRRILKGGSYRDGAEKLKVTFSDSDSPRGNARYYGFRVIVEIK